MNKVLSILLLFFFFSNVSAQDVIVKKDGSTILSKILEVNPSDIKYKKYSNLDGPVYTMQKSDLLSINYKNGERDVFNSNDIHNATGQPLNASNKAFNQKWLDYTNNRNASYKESQENK